MKQIFEGIRVIDFGNNVAAPLGAAMFADFGADVIKVEKPVIGDDGRGYSPIIDGKSVSDLWMNRGKRSIVLDVKNPEGKRLFLELLKDADVLMESFRPGVMQRLDLNWEILHEMFPKLIMCSISAFGQTGPYSALPGYDMIAQSSTGLMDVTGFPDGPPTKIGPSVADYCCAYTAFGAITAALYHRDHTGLSQYIDLSLGDCGIALNDHIELGMVNPSLSRGGNHHVLLGPYGVFNCSKGSITIAALNPKLWTSMCNLMGKPEYIDDPRFRETGNRAKPDVAPYVTEMITNWLEEQETIQSAEDKLRAVGIPCFRVVKLPELKNDEHFRLRNMICDFPTPSIKSHPVSVTRGNQIHMSLTPPVLKPGPDINEHADEIMQEVLGYTKEEMQNFIAAGAFGKQYEQN